MRKFPEKPNQIKVPECQDPIFEQRLKNQLSYKIFNKNPYQNRYKLSVATSGVTLMMLCLFVIKPNIINKIHDYFFGSVPMIENQDYAKQEYRSSNRNRSYLTDYTSINNPKVQSVLNSSEYKEKAAYVIRVYEAPGKDDITIFSEYQADLVKQKNKPKEVSF